MRTITKILIIFFVIFTICGGLFIIKSFNNDYNNLSNKDVNKLEDLGYSDKEIEIMNEKLNEGNVDMINEKDDSFIEFMKSDYFVSNNLERYKAYYEKNPNYSYKDVVMRVNIGLDYDFYDNITTVSNPDDVLVICNKYYALPGGFVPKDLVNVNGSNVKMTKVAAEKFELMAKASENDGVKIYPGSGYRSEDTQRSIYNRYVKTDGVKKADTYSARPGHSEHETGLAIDITTGNGRIDDSFIDTPQDKWLRENAYKYGFILRYPSDKVDITGYKYESWHYRYVGEDVAKIIYDNNLTYEEYYVMYLSK